MENQFLPIVPTGKYKDKSVLELLADKNYVEWFKQQSGFSTSEKWKPIYNIVVNQTITTNNQSSKTPEHNRLQNLFLDKNNQFNLVKQTYKNKYNICINKLQSLFEDASIIKCFGINTIPELTNNLDKSSIKFEDKFNWDCILYYRDMLQQITIISNLENEITDKAKYRKQYDIEQKEDYDNKILSYNQFIQIRENMDKANIDEYQIKINKYRKLECDESGGMDITTFFKPEKPNINKTEFIRYHLFDENTKNMWDKCNKILSQGGTLLLSVVDLNGQKEKYKEKYEEKYEEIFNNHYEKYRMQYYKDITMRYCNKSDNCDIFKINDNQYEISINICDDYSILCCELKPSLSDEYPCVLRKLNTQIELTKNDKTTFLNCIKQYILIIGSFTSIHTSREQLIEIFKQSNIKIIFIDEIITLSTLKTTQYINAETTQPTVDKQILEENKSITLILLQTQEKLLQAEHKIKQLEEEILLLKGQSQKSSPKSQPQNQSISLYFKK
jgi:predicted SAM-dependent methyltransferase